MPQKTYLPIIFRNVSPGHQSKSVSSANMSVPHCSKWKYEWIKGAISQFVLFSAHISTPLQKAIT